MARPIKDNADYFTHDADMRDDPKIKALRRKFKAEGYGIWNMLLEAITDSDNFRLTIDLEIMAGDFDVTPELLDEIIIYACKIGLLRTDEERQFLWSKTLDKRFEPLLSKRERDRGAVIVSENPQSKVKNSREEKEKREFDTLTIEVNTFLKRNLNSNTADVRAMVQKWLSEGYREIFPQLKAMKAVYQAQNLVFPTRLQTLTDSFQTADWIQKLKELDPEVKAENIAKEKRNGKQRTAEPDTIGTSEPGSLG